MSASDFHAILAAITRQAPLDLDEPARDGAPCISLDAPDLPPVAALWSRQEGGNATIGVLVLRPLDDASAIALRLAAAAIERAITPIILTALDRSGFEGFGFRVERLSSSDRDTSAAEIAEIAAFWDMSIVIDANDVSRLG